MRLFVDSAEIRTIAEALTCGYIYGVTTNPTLLRRANVPKYQVPELAHQAFANGAQEIQLQVYATEPHLMVQEGKELAQIDPQRVVVKIPATPAGYTAAVQLAHMGIRITLTAVYTLSQALVAQSVGAHYIAVYLGRMRDEGLDALSAIKDMQAIQVAQRSPVEILAASIREPQDVEALGMLGVGAATLPPALLGALLFSPATARAAAVFSEDAFAIASTSTTKPLNQ